MDLKSMLNEANTHKHAPGATQPSPPPGAQYGTPQSSHRAAAPYPVDPRSTPVQATPTYPPDPRSPGSYFPPQSPYPHNSASTPIANGGQWHAASPGIHGGQYNTSYGNPPQHSPRAPSSSHSSPRPPGWYDQSYHSRQHSAGLSAVSSQPRHVMPNTPVHNQPRAPLGPPAPLNRPSSQTPRPLSQGHEHYRTHSSSSIGSQLGQEHGAARVTASPQQQTYPPSAHRYSTEPERERSESVSPKTIPHVLPPRQLSTESMTQSFGTLASSQQPQTLSNYSQQNITPPEQTDQGRHFPAPAAATAAQAAAAQAAAAPPPLPPPPSSSSITPQHPHFLSTEPGPVAEMVAKTETPQSATGPTTEKSLKRAASAVSTTSAASQPRKRPRRDEIPIFARSARQGPLKLSKDSSVTSIKPSAVTKPPIKKEPNVNGNTAPVPPAGPVTLPWEPSITNLAPYEDLTRYISDWIVGTIDKENAPSGGAVFEIEAKIGEIRDIEEGQRLSLPVGCETIFLRDRWRRTKFESSMDQAQHKLLNGFLNSCYQNSRQNPGRIPIDYDHRYESDQFYELNTEGIRALPPTIRPFLDPRHRPRVRITSDRDSLKPIARIIKSRIADIEVYNPASDFDYRISISVESPWDGDNMHLIPLKEHGMERNKDRVSYRHVGYQIDLTQVSYPDGSKQQHELEVEISTEQVRLELANLKAQRASNYEQLVNGFIDNVRILCRKGTIGGGR